MMNGLFKNITGRVVFPRFRHLARLSFRRRPLSRSTPTRKQL